MSTLPRPPQDPEYQRTIDCIAEYIAKNGPASEEATRQQHYGNPNFSFLSGGEFSDYYKYRLICEIQNLKNTAAAHLPQFMPPPDQMIPLPSQFMPPRQTIQPQLSAPQMGSMELEVKKLEEQMKALRKQIVDSESNLKAHEVALNVQKQTKVEALWRAQEDKRINDLIKQVGLNIAAFDKHLERLKESGSKETISNSKKWIFDNCNSDRLREIILLYLLHRVREKTVTDAFRLHVLYLINDWAHYCQRKKMDAPRQMLSRYVPKLYAYATNSNVPNAHDLVEKLEKLVGVWEGHKYFDDSCYKQLRNPTTIMATEQAAAFAEQHQLSIEVDKEIGETLGTYTKQHKEFEQHILTNITTLEMQVQEIKDRMEAAGREKRQRAAEEENRAAAERRRASRFDQQNAGPQKIPSLFEVGTGQPPPLPHGPDRQHFPPPLPPKQHHHLPPHPPQAEADLQLMPKAPYYELPAGMMFPLIKLDDITYKPLKTEELRLPPPEPPSEHLMRELDRFYSAMQIPPPIDCIRDADGWEMNGLIQHYIKKSEQRMKLEEKMKKEGKTLEDAFLNKYKTPSARNNVKSDVRKARSRSPSPSSSARNNVISDARKARSRSSSSSSSSSSGGSSSNSSSSRSRSGSSTSSSPSRKSRSPSPVEKRRRRSRSATPEERPSFFPSQPAKSSAISFKIPPLPLNRETNKGAQLMAKMGWEGKGLGSKGQGIEEPVHGGEVREKTDQYRGVGSKPDIFEEYRKQMSTQMAKRMQKF